VGGPPAWGLGGDKQPSPIKLNICYKTLCTALVVGCCECGDEPLGSCTTELVFMYQYIFMYICCLVIMKVC
jgi:hypothetical protein